MVLFLQCNYCNSTASPRWPFFNPNMRLIQSWCVGVLFMAIGVVAQVLVEQVQLTYDVNPENVFVTFAAWSNESHATIHYGVEEDKLVHQLVVPGSKYTLNGYTSPMLYRGQLSNLKAGNKKYFYKTGSPALGYSPVKSFKTHPGVGVNDVTFHIFGDLGQTENSVATLDELIQYEANLASHSGGIISMGDLSYANGDEPLWDTFDNMISVATAQIPISTTLGNHEWFDSSNYDFTAYKARTINPLVNNKRELYYSFESGLVHFVMIAGMNCITCVLSSSSMKKE